MDYDLIVVKTLERVYKNYYYIIRGKIMKKDSVKKETWKEWEQTCEKLKKYETTLKRVVLTTDKKLLYQAEYNRKIRAAQRQQ